MINKSSVCWWIGFKLWPFNRIAAIRNWAHMCWVRGQRQRAEAAARMLLASDWRGMYATVDGVRYELRISQVNKEG